MDKVFIFVIASFEEECYFDMIAMRKLLFKKYNIANRFIFDKKHELYEADDNDVFISSTFYCISIPNPHLNPKMILKFMKTIKNFDETKYDYILRINLSTYINFNLLLRMLQSLPKYKLLSGHIMNLILPDWDIYNKTPIKFVSGTCMIFSSDVITHLKLVDLNDHILYKHNDDTVLSHIILEYTQSIINQSMIFSGHNHSENTLKTSTLIRIKYSDRKLDVDKWKYLIMLNDNIYYLKYRPALPRIFIFWTGTNALTENRVKCINSIKSVTGINILLITPNNLSEWIVDPLHKGYEYLSSVHKADYLRCYFMHHHGGGYTDIKEQTGNWLESFRRLNISNNMITIGYQEVEGGVARVKDDDLYNEMSKNYKEMIGNGAYIFKPNTFLTKQWYHQLHSELDNKFEALKLNPASNHRDHTGLWLGNKHSTYPIEWSGILGQIFQPLAYAHRKYILQGLPTPVFYGYM